MLVMIASRANSNLDPPRFVAPIRDLPPRFLSWDEKPSEKRLKALNPPVNIIGCNHSLELILAKADWRARQVHRVNETKIERIEQKLKQLDGEINFKNGRAARYAALVELQQKQVAWLRTVSVLAILNTLHERYQSKRAILIKMQHDTYLALTIKRVVLRWYNYRIYKKYTARFRFNSVNNFRFLLRIRRKNKAVSRIVHFMRDFRLSCGRIKSVIHHFMRAARILQRYIRGCLAMKKARLEALSLLWLGVESAYLRKVLKQRREKRKPRVIAMTADLSLLDRRSKETMTKQASKWAHMDAKVEATVARLRARKVLASGNEEDEIRRFLLPGAVRRALMERMAYSLRKDFYKRQSAAPLTSKAGKHVRSFNEADAFDMLMGRNIDRIYSSISGVSAGESVQDLLVRDAQDPLGSQVRQKRPSKEAFPRVLHLLPARGPQCAAGRHPRGPREAAARGAVLMKLTYLDRLLCTLCFILSTKQREERGCRENHSSALMNALQFIQNKY
mmetsp:Transcript_23995/g.32876  ORF Transcript_23995/g.32876 Transcript_23995/m.32876 type:complete len:505 (-) Transcript_23995:791-2305(-)